MKKLMKKALVYLTTLAMCLSLSPAALAADGTDFQIDKSKTADTEVLDRDNPVTEVTLSLPSGESQYEYDIVFVMDSSTSTANSNLHFDECVGELLDEVTAKNAKINVAIIKCRGRAFDTIELASNEEYSGLVEYSDDTRKAIIDGVKYSEDDLKAKSSGTNMHGGLIMANDLLENDTEVPDTQKFVVMLLDGKTYIWNNEEGEPTTYYTQYMAKNKVYTTPTIGQSTGSYTKSAYKFKDKGYYNYELTDSKEVKDEDLDKCFYFSDFSKLYEREDNELGSTDTDYDYYCYYADKKPATAEGEANEHSVTNGNFTYQIHKKYYEFTPDPDWVAQYSKEFKYLEAAPYEVDENEDGTYTFDLESPNKDFYQVHPDSLQKGLYLTGHLWTEMGKKYNTVALPYSGWGGGSGLEIAKSFDTWILDTENGISDYAAEYGNENAVVDVFDSVKEDIIYLIDSGTVTDEITEPFDLIMDGYGENHPFKLVVGEDEFTGIAGEEDNTWLFGNQNEEGLFPYEVSWDSETNTFTWTIHVPVENANPVQLSYKLKWNGKGEAGVKTPTNGSTLLEYTTTDGTDGEEEFESPEVLYPIQITYNANYTGGPADVIDRGDGDNYYKKGDNATLKGADLFTRSGYTFSGWSLTADGAATYQPGGIYEKLPGDVTLYAIWTQNQGGGGTPGGSDGGRTSTVTIDPVEVPLAEIPEELNGADHFAYVEGYPDGTVKPEGNISRSETTTMLYRLLNPEWRDKCFTDQNAFSDVAKPQWYNKAVSSMAKGTYVEGYPDGTFKGNNSITRAEFVTIMVRFLDEQLTYNNPFTDIDDHWAKSYILKAVGAGWINGYPDGTFRPDTPITRVEAMKIINSVLHRGVDVTSELGDYINFPDNSDPNKWYYYEVIEAVNNHEYVGERPSENWTRNAVDYFYDINKYERPEA